MERSDIQKLAPGLYLLQWIDPEREEELTLLGDLGEGIRWVALAEGNFLVLKDGDGDAMPVVSRFEDEVASLTRIPLGRGTDQPLAAQFRRLMAVAERLNQSPTHVLEVAFDRLMES
ncbi:MAG: hypothetical protein AAGA48_28810 [Myxococcota bacterium]